MTFEDRPTDPYDRPPAYTPVAERATWGIRHIAIGIVAVLVLLFLIQGAIVFPVDALTDSGEQGSDDTASQEVYFASAVANLLWQMSYVAAVIIIVRRTGGTLASLGLVKPHVDEQHWYARAGRWLRSRFFVPLGPLPIAVVAGYLGSIAAVQVYIAIIQVLGLDFLIPDAQLPDEVFGSTAVTIMTGITVIFGAPISEEILFRGFIFGGLRRKMALVPAGLVGGVLFSLAHLQFGLILPFAIIGLIFAYTYEKTGSLYTAMSIHIIFNAISFLLLTFVPEAR